LSNSPQEIRSKYIDADPGNGFGAKYLTRSLVPPDPDGREGPVKACLDGVQILTRYCSRERPYWDAFVDHYVRSGVKFIHACVQGQDDRRDLLESPFPSSAELVVHLLPDDLDNAAALRSLDVTSVVGRAPYTMMVDCDEYFHTLNPGVSIQDLFAIFPDAGQFYIPWAMCPVLGDNNSESAGFWGQTGKPVARSERIASIAQEHGFRIDSTRADPRDSSIPAGTFGCVLIHYWSRGFRDCLLKTFNNRIKESKSSDLALALDKIRSGDLPIRLRLLAYLSCQARYLTLPDPPFASFDRSTEEAILRRHLSEKDEDFCRNVFEGYLWKLRKRIRAYPLYPAVSIQRVARLLPSPQELDYFEASAKGAR